MDAGPPGPLVITEQEPNDRPEQAQKIAEDALVSGSLSADPSKPDYDVYDLVSPRPRIADVSVEGVPDLNLTLEVLDRDRNVLLTASQRIPNLKVSGDTWVRVSSPKKGMGGAYRLQIRFSAAPKGAELEPNDRAVDATLMGLLPPEEPLKTTGLIGHPGDEDWFRIDLTESSPSVPIVQATAPTASTTVLDASTSSPPLPPPSEDAGTTTDGGVLEEARTALRIDVTPVPKVRLELTVFSAAQAPLFSVKSKEGEGLSLRNIGVRSTDSILYVVLKSAWSGTGKDARRGANPDVPYTLSVSREAAGANAELEPNDELAKATPLPRGGFREGFLSPKGDIDYFVVRAEEPGLTQLQVSGVDRVDLVLSVVRPALDGGVESTLLVANDGALKEPEVLNNVKCAPECYVKVHGGTRKVDNQLVRDYENTEQPYRIAANPIAPGNLEVEPNNTPDQANTLTLGQSVRGTIHPKKDLDYYRLDLSERPVKTSLTATLTGILKVDVGLYLYSLDEDGKAELVQTSDKAKGDAPEVIHFTADPGVYLFVVRDSKNRESNFQDSYQLTVREGE